MWTDDKDSWSLFMTGAVAALKTNGHMPITASTENPVPARALQQWGAPARYALFESAPTALADFMEFSKTWAGWTPQTTKVSLTRFQIQFSVPYGKGGFVTFSAEGVPIRSEDMSVVDVEQAYRELWDFVQLGAIDFYNNAPKLAMAAGAHPDDGGTRPTDDTQGKIEHMECSHIVVEDLPSKRGTGTDRFYKLAGGKYTEHGVRVWPEVLEAAGVNLEKVKPGRWPVKKGATMDVLLTPAGKASKVVRLTPA